MPGVVLASVGATALVAVDELAPPTATAVVGVDGARPATPLLSIRRDPALLLAPVAEHAFAARLGQWVAAQPPDTCLVVTLDGPGDHTLFDHRGGDPQIPASAQKLYTAVAALTRLGPEHRFRTVVASATPVAAGAVAGDLHLIGGGDPILSTGLYAAHFTHQPRTFSDIGKLADAVVAAGVRRVQGSVVGDERRYDQVRYNPAWPDRYIVQDQTGPLSALAVDDGFAAFPPKGAEPVEPAPDPAAHAADVLTRELVARGVAVAGPPRSGAAPAGVTAVASHESPTLGEIVRAMLLDSDNDTAELLVKELGFADAGRGTFPAGVAAVVESVADAGVPTVSVTDGSGLALENQVTCTGLVQVLGHRPTHPALYGSLPVSGRTGTLRGRWLETPVVGRIRAKTGTLNQVTSLAGYADTTPGRRLRFALVVNVGAGERIQRETVQAQQQLAEILVSYPELPDTAPFAPLPPVGGGA